MFWNPGARRNRPSTRPAPHDAPAASPGATTASTAAGRRDRAAHADLPDARRVTPLTPEQYRLTQDAVTRASLRWITVR